MKNIFIPPDRLKKALRAYPREELFYRTRIETTIVFFIISL